ncbi:hypothetical protein WISP_142911 [Willisornis vidua]|uniref:Uncharacterized protein n=1 Tax=Willisornis vidua TaxID=1566151 RepID=A0ABQ9CLJ4_9PASS|nr:hypothetical protein WISP_142911 [Willisornis vidua]
MVFAAGVEYISSDICRDMNLILPLCFGVLVDEKLNMTWQCALAAQKAIRVLGYIESSLASRLREGILPLYFTPVRPNLNCNIQLWDAEHGKVMDLQEKSPKESHKASERDGAPLL